jgi:superfamily I DNA/RNA helicase
LEHAIGRELDVEARLPRRILRLRNSIISEHDDGVEYLQDVFSQFLEKLSITLDDHEWLRQSQENYFDDANDRLADPEYNVPSDVESLRRFFRHPAGVVVNTCHGVKGEEYTTVVCFGLLRGYIPHWEEVFDENMDDAAESRKLLYVVSSRAKLNVHLIAEHGRETRRGDPYETTRELANAVFDYDAPDA